MIYLLSGKSVTFCNILVNILVHKCIETREIGICRKYVFDNYFKLFKLSQILNVLYCSSQVTVSLN